MKSVAGLANIDNTVRSQFENSPIRWRNQPPSQDFLQIAEKIKLLNRCISIFQKARDERNVEDYEILCKALSLVKFLTDNVTPGSNMNDFLKQCADMMQFQTFSKDSAIFHYGDPADNLYMILKGSVAIYVPKSAEQLEQERNQSLKTKHAGDELHVHSGNLIKPKNTTESNQTKRQSKFLPENLQETRSEPKEPKVSFPEAGTSMGSKFKAKASAMMTVSSVARNFQGNFQGNHDYELFSSFVNHTNLYLDEEGRAKMKRLRILGPGNVFGELALSTNKPRTASVIASDDISVVSLSKEDYKVVFDLTIKALKVKMEYFCAFFDQCAYDTVSRFAYVFQEKKYSFGQLLYQQGDPPNGIFLVKEGEVQLSVRKPETPLSRTRPRGHVPSIDSLNHNSKNTKPVYKNVKISMMSAGSMIGCEEVVEEAPRNATALIRCDTGVYWAPSEEVRDLMFRHNEFRDKINEYHLRKREYNTKRIDEIRNTRRQINSFLKTVENTKDGSAGGFKLRSEVLENLYEETSSENISSRRYERDSSPIDTKREKQADKKGLELFGHKSKQHSLYARSSHTQEFFHHIGKYEGDADSFRFHTEQSEQTQQEHRYHPTLPVSPAMRIEEEMLPSQGYQDSRSRKRVIRGTTSKDFNNDATIMIPESPPKLTIAKRMQQRLAIVQNNKMSSDEDISEWPPLDFHLDKQPIKRAIKSHVMPRKISPFKLTSDNLQKPYENQAILSSMRNAVSPLARIKTAVNSNSKQFLVGSKSGAEITTYGFNNNKQMGLSATTRGNFIRGKNTETQISFTKQQSPWNNNTNWDSLEICGNGIANQNYDLDSVETLTARDMELISDNRNQERTHDTRLENESKTYNTTTAIDSVQEITLQDLANLELASPWAKKKATLTLNMHCIKPCYFVEVESENRLKHVSSSTKNAELKGKPLADLQSLALVAPNGLSNFAPNDSARKTSLRSSLISSKHNLFRLKPGRQYIINMNYEIKNHRVATKKAKH